MRTELTIRFDYGSLVPWVRRTKDALTAIGGVNLVRVHTPGPAIDLRYRVRNTDEERVFAREGHSVQPAELISMQRLRPQRVKESLDSAVPLDHKPLHFDVALGEDRLRRETRGFFDEPRRDMNTIPEIVRRAVYPLHRGAVLSMKHAIAVHHSGTRYCDYARAE